jgi:hypothetical protein
MEEGVSRRFVRDGKSLSKRMKMRVGRQAAAYRMTTVNYAEMIL